MPSYETATTRANKKHTNGSLSFYRKNVQYLHTLWVTKLDQLHEVSGTRSQSMHQAHWYPRSYQPGDISVTIRCRTQADYQRLSNMLRLHHRTMLETPGLRFSGRPKSEGLRHLLHLRVPTEAISVWGWVPTFTRTQRGVHEVAPEVTFGFFTALDPYSSDPIVSHQIREWWNPNKMSPQGDPFAVDPAGGNPNGNDPNAPQLTPPPGIHPGTNP